MKYLNYFESNKVKYKDYSGYSYTYRDIDFIIWKSGGGIGFPVSWYIGGNFLEENLTDKDYSEDFKTKKNAKEIAEHHIDKILKRKEEALLKESKEDIGKTMTFIAKHKEKGHSFGAGFSLLKKNKEGKFLEPIACVKGTEITGKVTNFVSVPGLGEYWTLELPDGDNTNIYSDFFDKK